MRIMSLLASMLVGIALPLQAAPPGHPDVQAQTAPAPASTAEPRSRIGEVMGSLTRALRDAAAQQSQHAPQVTPATAAPSPAGAASPAATALPDATAQATVP